MLDGAWVPSVVFDFDASSSNFVPRSGWKAASSGELQVSNQLFNDAHELAFSHFSSAKVSFLSDI